MHLTITLLAAVHRGSNKSPTYTGPATGIRFQNDIKDRDVDIMDAGAPSLHTGLWYFFIVIVMIFDPSQKQINTPKTN
jgi:hypothetical protein